MYLFCRTGDFYLKVERKTKKLFLFLPRRSIFAILMAKVLKNPKQNLKLLFYFVLFVLMLTFAANEKTPTDTAHGLAADVLGTKKQTGPCEP